jgi:mRNA-degrading endonuclease toxin of MazEF toxin-antitoxin module
MARGDVLLVNLPVPSSSPAHEQIGKRPALEVQNNASDPRIHTVIVIPFTSKLNALRYPHTLRIDPSPQNGLTNPSVLLFLQLRVIDKFRITGNIGRLEQHYMQQVDNELRNLLGI